MDWAAVRAANGHPEPYGVHFWEVGNEPMHLQSRSNDVGHLHSVRLHRTWARADGQDLVRTFPAASTTLLRIKLL